MTLRRLVAQGRLGQKAGQGFYAYPQADEGDQTETVKLETRGDVAIAWLANGMMNAVSPDVVKDLGTVWEKVKSSGDIGAMVIASANPLVFSAGADIKAFTQMDEAGGEDLIHSGHALLRDLGQNRVSTIAAVNSLAFGGGCELSMACDFRIAAESAIFGQPEIKLGIIPGFGGTQRLPRLVGPHKALEMNLIGDAITAHDALEHGLVNRVVPDHELFDTAIAWARKLAGPGAARRRGDQEGLAQGRPRRGHRGREAGLRGRVPDRGRQGGHLRIPRQAQGAVEGSVTHSRRCEEAERLAGLLRDSASTVVLTGAGVSVPSGIPDFRTPGTGLWEKVDPFEVAHIDAFHADTARFWRYYRPRFHELGSKEPNDAHRALAELEARAASSRPSSPRTSTGCTARPALKRVIEVHGTIETSSCTECGESVGIDEVESLFGADEIAICAGCGGKVKPDVVLFGEMLPEACDERGDGALRGGRPGHLRRLVARGLSRRGPSERGSQPRRQARDRHEGPDAV